VQPIATIGSFSDLLKWRSRRSISDSRRRKKINLGPVLGINGHMNITSETCIHQARIANQTGLRLRLLPTSFDAL
jgi:hypothetical protein